MPKNDELQALFNLLAQRLGTQPEQLKSSAQSGDLSKIIAVSYTHLLKFWFLTLLFE